jgi:membrane-associated phospholipid phosphatase
MPKSWAEAIVNRKFILQFLSWLAGLILFITILPHFLNGILVYKPGVQLSDFILNWFSPRDWSVEIFILIYGAPALFFIFSLRSPERILLSVQCYVMVSFMRIISLYLFTLEAADGIIPLVDPFLAKVAYGGHDVFVKDLFFSGHTSTLFIVFLIEKKKWLKTILLIATILVGLLLMWQRVHYTIDVLGGIFVSFCVYWSIRRLNSRIF